MSKLSITFILKIILTLLFWSLPLILFPATLLECIGFPPQQNYMFVRLLGWAYLALCVGYGFGLRASLNGERQMGPIWVGIVSNGGACLYLLFYGLSGTWTDWALTMRILLWGSTLATGLITLGLITFGVFVNKTSSS